MQGAVSKHIELSTESEVLTVGRNKLQMIAEPIVYNPSAKMYYQRTLVFPLQKAGDFKSRITGVKVVFLGTDYTDYAEACAMFFRKIRVIRVIRA